MILGRSYPKNNNTKTRVVPLPLLNLKLSCRNSGEIIRLRAHYSNFLKLDEVYLPASGVSECELVLNITRHLIGRTEVNFQ